MSSSTQKATISTIQEHLRKLCRSHMQELLGDEPLQTTILSCITDSLDSNIIKNTYTLLGLWKIHSEAIKKIDSSFNENIDLLLNTNANQLLNHLPTPLKPTIAYPSKLVVTPEEPVSIRYFSPLNNKSPSPVVFKQTQQTEWRNPYPFTWSPLVEQIFPKKPPANRRTVINLHLCLSLFKVDQAFWWAKSFVKTLGSEIIQWVKRKVDCLGQSYRIQSYPRVYIVK